MCVILLVPVAFASSDNCVDNETLRKTYNYSFLYNNVDLGNLSIPSYQHCADGCDSVTNSCSPSQLNLTFYAVIGIFGFLLTIGLLIKVWKR